MCIFVSVLADLISASTIVFEITFSSYDILCVSIYDIFTVYNLNALSFTHMCG